MTWIIAKDVRKEFAKNIVPKEIGYVSGIFFSFPNLILPASESCSFIFANVVGV